jgi:YVTN family beta-propeller protein
LGVPDLPGDEQIEGAGVVDFVGSHRTPLTPLGLAIVTVALVIASVASGLYFRPSAGDLGHPTGGLIAAGSPAGSALYAETFTEAGLPSGSTWNVTLNGQIQSAVAPSSIVFLEPNGTYPYTITGSFGWELVGASATGTVHVAGAPDRVAVPSIGVGTLPDGIAYDASNGFVYTANDQSYNVTAINGSVDRAVGPGIGVGPNPNGIASDPSNGYLYVLNFGSNNVTVINGATDTVVVPSIGVGTQPDGIAFDPSNGYVYVSNYISNNVTVINGATDTVVVPSIGAGIEPDGIAYDPSNGYLYVANYNSNNVTVINGATDTVVVPSVGVGSGPYRIAYDSSNGYLYVTNYNTNNLTVINGATDQVVVPSIGVGTAADGIAYDPLNGYLYVSNLFTNNVTVIDGATDQVVVPSIGVGTSPDEIVYDASNGFLYVANFGSTNVTVINGNGWLVTHWKVAPRYSVTLTETGLLSGTNWSATLNGSTVGSNTTTIGFQEPNGSYAITIAAIPGWMTAMYHEIVTVRGAPTGVAVPWIRATSSVTFTETGLPSGTNWSVTVNGSTVSSNTTTIMFQEPNGSYATTIAAIAGWMTPMYREIVTVRGGPTGIVVPWTRATYSVTFAETGLPLRTSWSVTVNGSLTSSTTSTIGVSEANGTFDYSVGAVPGFTSAPTSGSVPIRGGPANLAITFTAVPATTYGLTFAESGLPPRTNWSVNLNGTTLSSTTSTIVFMQANGSYGFTVPAIVGYSATPASGNLPVNGHPETQGITFTSTASAGSSGGTSTPLTSEWWFWAAVGGLVGAIAILVAVVLIRRRRTGPEDPRSPA